MRVSHHCHSHPICLSDVNEWVEGLFRLYLGSTASRSKSNVMATVGNILCALHLKMMTAVSDRKSTPVCPTCSSQIVNGGLQDSKSSKGQAEGMLDVMLDFLLEDGKVLFLEMQDEDFLCTLIKSLPSILCHGSFSFFEGIRRELLKLIDVLLLHPTDALRASFIKCLPWFLNERPAKALFGSDDASGGSQQIASPSLELLARFKRLLARKSLPSEVKESLLSGVGELMVSSGKDVQLLLFSFVLLVSSSFCFSTHVDGLDSFVSDDLSFCFVSNRLSNWTRQTWC